MKTVNIRVKPEIRKKLKALAVKHGKNLNDVIEILLK